VEKQFVFLFLLVN